MDSPERDPNTSDISRLKRAIRTFQAFRSSPRADSMAKWGQRIITALILGIVTYQLFEIGWAIGLKYTDGFTRLWPSVFTLLSMAFSVLLLGLAVKQLPIGTAYGVWVGIGAMGTAIAGIILLGEGVSLLKIASLILILLGVLGLKLAH